MYNIPCPHCGKRIELSEAIIHQLSKAQVDKARAEEREKAEKEAKETSLKESLKKDKKLKELEEKIAKDKEEKERNEEKIKEDAKKEAEKEIEVKLKQKDIQLEQVKKINQDLNRKLEQGSQQLQGEALEQNLEENLKNAFKYDDFIPVPKGVKGADILQQVKNKYGNVASLIIWEFKRTKTWDKNWLEKLREDARVSNANESVLVSEVLPNDIKVYGKIDGVWITNREYAIPLATIIREMGIRIAIAKAGVQHDDVNLKKIHDYILSEKFRHKIEKDVETAKKSLEMLEKKHNVDDKYYRLQKLSLEALKANTTQIYFDLQEILPALPSIAGLEGELLEDNNEQESLI